MIGEVIEHVGNDVLALQRCCDMAGTAVLVTTPVGSCDSGFHENARWREHTEHVRAYTERSLRATLNKLVGVTYDEIKVLDTCSGLTGQQMECFCVRLDKVKETADGNQQHQVVTAQGSQA